MIRTKIEDTWQNPHRKLRDIFAYKIGLRQELVYAKTWATIWNLIRFFCCCYHDHYLFLPLLRLI